ncbi:MAG: hypothetical protein ABI197_03415 [Granulicella sp.]
MNNADLRYRPVLAGISIVNARIGEPGTLGYIAADGDGALWIVSAYHVLCGAALESYIADEAIYQPAAAAPENRIAVTRATRANAALDCAAALLDLGITTVSYQIGIGASPAPIEPVVGMRVIKAGAVSGITEGIVQSVDGDTVRIAADPAFPADYVLSEPGDSGALWVEQQSRAPVALHLGRSSSRRAEGLSFRAVLAALQLQSIA